MLGQAHCGSSRAYPFSPFHHACLRYVVACGGTACQARVDDAARLPVCAGVAEHRGQEGFRLSRDTVAGVCAVTVSAHRTAQQDDLSCAVVASALAQEVIILPDIELTRGDRVVGISVLALADQDGTGRHFDRRQGRREVLDRGRGQFGKQPKGTQQGELGRRP